MKKLVLIVGLVLVAASCQKEQIVPNSSAARTSNGAAIQACPTAEDPNTPTPGGISSTGGTTVTGDTDGGATIEDDGDITDPMRKKERKGNN